MKLSRWFALSALAMVFTVPAMAKDWKTVTVAMEGSYEPWNMTDASGKIVGFEVDILNDVCARMKVECKIVAQDWDGVIPSITTSNLPAVRPGMTPSQSCATILHSTFMRAQTSFRMSTSKPTILPLASVMFQGS